MAAWLHAIDSDGLVVNGVNSVFLPQISKPHPLHVDTAKRRLIFCLKSDVESGWTGPLHGREVDRQTRSQSRLIESGWIQFQEAGPVRSRLDLYCFTALGSRCSILDSWADQSGQ
jgi:hypothetical protein